MCAQACTQVRIQVMGNFKQVQKGQCAHRSVHSLWEILSKCKKVNACTGTCTLLGYEIVSLFILGYHWLPLATMDLVGDNREPI